MSDLNPFEEEELPAVTGTQNATLNAWNSGGQQAANINRGGLVIGGRTGDVDTSVMADVRCRVYELGQQKFFRAEIEFTGAVWRLKS